MAKNKKWDDISYMNGYGRWIWIDRRSNYIIHFNGSIRYDFSRFGGSCKSRI